MLPCCACCAAHFASPTRESNQGRKSSLSWRQIGIEFNSTPLFGICLYKACRINEACALLTTDAYDPNGVRAKITIRKSNTKGQQDTRQVATHSALAGYLDGYQSQGKEGIESDTPSEAGGLMNVTAPRAGVLN